MKFYNCHNLGDCLFAINYIINLCKYNKIDCEFACHEQYHEQLSYFIPLNYNIKLTSTYNGGIDLWGSTILYRVRDNDPNNYPFYCNRYPQLQDTSQMIFKMYDLISIENNLISPFKTKYDTMINVPILDEMSPRIKKNYDYLIINSDCLSGQIKLNNDDIDNIFKTIIEQLILVGKSFITTKKIDNYPCTLDDSLFLHEIAQISKNCEVVIGFPTAPFNVSVNKNSYQNNVKFINITQDTCTFDLGENYITFNDVYNPKKLILLINEKI